MEREGIPVRANIDPKTFRRFALFDTFCRRKRWRGPLLFAAILSAFSIVCFALQGRKEQAVLLGAVLLAVGIGLPAAYFASYLLSVNAQAQKLGLSASRTAYTLYLGERAVRVVSGKERAEFPWASLFRAYRTGNGVYLYADPRKAFLLPEAQVTEAVWQRIQQCVPADRLHDLRKSDGISDCQKPR